MVAPSSAMLLTAVVMASLLVHAHALTAFGKSNSPEKESQPKPKVPKGRVCNNQADCMGTPSTSCTVDKASGKRHCLCRDGTPPVNSKCAVIPNEPGKPCSEHADCVLNAECIVANETRKKTCACKDGYDFDKSIDDTSCSGSCALWPGLLTLLLTLTVLAITEPRARVTS